MNRRAVIIALLLAASAAPEPAASQKRPIDPFIGVHYGVPLNWSVALAVTLPAGSGTGGAFIAAEPGIGGWRASAGYFRITSTLGSGYAARASFLHTRSRAWRAPTDATFIGAEMQYMPAFMLGLRAGVFARLNNPSRRKGLFTVDLSFLL